MERDSGREASRCLPRDLPDLCLMQRDIVVVLPFHNMCRLAARVDDSIHAGRRANGSVLCQPCHQRHDTPVSAGAAQQKR